MVEGWSVGSSKSGVPLAMAMRFATRDDIDSALVGQEPPFERPDMPPSPGERVGDSPELHRDAPKRALFFALSGCYEERGVWFAK